jgi:hypothetical protein
MGERALKIVLVIVALLPSGLVFPCLMFGKQEHCVGDDAEPVCHTSTFFLLLAPRSSSANRSLIAFTDGMQASLNLVARGELVGDPEASQSRPAVD